MGERQGQAKNPGPPALRISLDKAIPCNHSAGPEGDGVGRPCHPQDAPGHWTRRCPAQGNLQKAIRAMKVAWTAWAEVIDRIPADQWGGAAMKAVQGQAIATAKSWVKCISREAKERREKEEEARRLGDDPAQAMSERGKDDEAPVPKRFTAVKEAETRIQETVATMIREARRGKEEDKAAHAVRQAAQGYLDAVAKAQQMDPGSDESSPEAGPRKRERKRLRRKTRVLEMEQPSDSIEPAPIVGTARDEAGSKGRRRRGVKKSKKCRKLAIFYGNESSLSKKAEDYVMGSPYNVVMLGETHKRGRRLEEAKARFARAGWSSTWSAAQPSEDTEDGSYGGTVTAVRGGWRSEPLRGEQCKGRSASSSLPDMSVRVLDTSNGGILLIGGYCRGGDYRRQLEEVYRITDGGERPYIWISDFNKDYRAVSADPLLRHVKGEVVYPTGGASCHQGKRGGTFIDFAVVSSSIRPYVISAKLIHDVPWGPHDGVEITLSLDPNAAFAYHCPRVPASLPALDHEKPMMSWGEAVIAAEGEVVSAKARKLPKEVERAAKRMDTAEASCELGRDYEVWSRAREIQALSQAGIEPASEEAKRYRGRARGHGVSKRQLRSALRDENGCPGTGDGPHAMAWATLGSTIKKRQSAVKGQSEATTRSTWSALVGAVGGRVRCLRWIWNDVAGHTDAVAAMMAIIRSAEADATDQALGVAAGLADRLEEAAAKKHREKAKRRFSKHVRDNIRGGASQLYKWTNQENQPSRDISVEGCNDEDLLLKDQTEMWAGEWDSKNAGRVAVGFTVVRALRQRAQLSPGAIDDAKGRINVANLNRVMGGIRNTKFGGIDGVRKEDYRDATSEAKKHLCAIMKKALDRVAWPHQVLLLLLNIRGKPAGGSRVTATAALFYRTLMAMTADPVRRWDTEAARDGDTAVRGKDAETAVAERQLVQSMAVRKGMTVVCQLWDASKYFDHITSKDVLLAVTSDGMPVVQVSMGFMVHRAPRVIASNDITGGVIEEVGCSVIQGCTLSTSIARSVMNRVDDDLPDIVDKELLREGEKRHNREEPGTDTFLHIDDRVQQTMGWDREATIRAASVRGAAMAISMKRHGITVSAKSTTLASDREAARLTADNIGRMADITVGHASAHDDLGVTTAAGCRRAVAKQDTRQCRATKQARRVYRVAKETLQAAKLVRGAVKPKMKYGGCVQGASPSGVARMAATTLAALNRPGKFSCGATTIEWRLGSMKEHPAVYMPAEQAKLTVKVAQGLCGARRRDLVAHWSWMARGVSVGAVTWSQSTDTVTALVLTLYSQGWDVDSARRLKSPRGGPLTSLMIAHE